MRNIFVLLFIVSINQILLISGYHQLPSVGVYKNYLFGKKISHVLNAKKNEKSKGFSNKKVNLDSIATDDKNKKVEKNSDSINLLSETKSDELIDEDAVFKKYGISNGDSAVDKKSKKKKQTKKYDSANPPPFGEEVIANLPMAMQQKIDNILVTSVFLSLTFVVACGVGISFGAFKVVFPQINLTPEIDSLIVNILSPSFTPSLGVFFFFSITFGLFKFAQISSSQTVYRED